MSIKVGVLPIEPTTSLDKAVEGLPVNLCVDPLREKFPYSDFIEIKKEDYTEDLLDEVIRQCRFYGYRAFVEEDTQLIDEMLIEQDIEESTQELQEMLKEVLGGADPIELIEARLLFEDAAQEVVKVAEKEIVDKLPKTRGEAVDYINDLIYKRLGLSEDASAEEIVRALKVALEASINKWEDQAKELKQTVEKQLPDASSGLMSKLWSILKWAVEKITGWLVSFAKRGTRYATAILTFVLVPGAVVAPFVPAVAAAKGYLTSIISWIISLFGVPAAAASTAATGVLSIAVFLAAARVVAIFIKGTQTKLNLGEIVDEIVPD